MGLKSYVWMIAGVMISIGAKIFDRFSDKGAFTLFFYLGIIFVAIGVLKIFFEKEPKKKKKSHAQVPGIVHCPNCKTKNHTVSNFCHKCGYQLPKGQSHHSWL